MRSASFPTPNGVHYDSELRRAPAIHKLVANGTLGETHCTDDGVGLVYRGTELVEVVSEVKNKAAFRVTAGAGESVDAVAVEERLEPRFLG
jgi:hypothetical protein